MNYQYIAGLAQSHGVVLRGGFPVRDTDAIPALHNQAPARSLLLFGQTGSSLWQRFSQSPEYSDGQPHPMDRWSERIGTILAEELEGRLLLPFGGPPHHPFQRWAQRIETVHPSMLGLLIHPEHGLWHAYRFAIAVADQVDALPEPAHNNPACHAACETCQSQPCLSACPVNAFDGVQYDVQACFEHLQNTPQSPCHTNGCRARDACPEGTQSRYQPEQIIFHMQQFYQSMAERSDTSES